MKPIKYKGQQFEAVEPTNEKRPCDSCYFKNNGCIEAPSCIDGEIGSLDLVWKLIETKEKQITNGTATK